MLKTYPFAAATSPKEVEDMWMALAAQQLCLPLKLFTCSRVVSVLPQHFHGDLHTLPATKQYLPPHPACSAS